MNKTANSTTATSPTTAMKSLSLLTSKHAILLVFDVNGTLLQRMARSGSDELDKFRELYGGNASPLSQQPSSSSCIPVDYKVVGKSGLNKALLRPGLRTFMRSLSQEFHVATWTSAMEKNITPLLRAAFPSPPLNQMFDFCWHKPECRVIGKDENNRHKDKVVKDLDRVWGLSSGEYSPDLMYIHAVNPSFRQHRWSPKNVILIDDSNHKAGNYTENLLSIPEFSVMNKHHQQDRVLDELLTYFRAMAASQPEDVRTYLKRTPFRATPISEPK